MRSMNEKGVVNMCWTHVCKNREYLIRDQIRYQDEDKIKGKES